MSVARAVAVLLIAGCVVGSACAEPPADLPQFRAGELTVGAYPEPPFAMKDAGGAWSGLAIDLWREVARRQGLAYRVEEHDLASLIDSLEARRVDVAVGSLLVTAQRERRMDMTSPYMHVSMAIGTRPASGWWQTLRPLVSGPILWGMIGLAVLLLIFAAIVWSLERHRNPEHFGGSVMRGIGDAVWWSASTMSTVGYGDRTPVTFWGRAVGMVWMFASIVLVSAFIAGSTSALTVWRLRTQIHSLQDLAHVRTGVVAASGAAEYLNEIGIGAVGFPTIQAAVDAVTRGDVDAVVGEWPVLEYLAHHGYAGRLAVVPQPLARGFVAFALPRDSPQLRLLNVTLLEVLADPDWDEITRKYLGP